MHQLTCVALPNSFSPEAEREILDILSPELRVRMQRIAIESKRRTAMAGAVLVRLLAAEATGIPNTELRFSVRSNGKPYVENAPDFCFNLTHTKEFFAVATANTEIGVDAEAVRPCKLQIARRFFTSNECAYVEAEDTPRRFFEIWTKKEAFIKRDGRGMQIPLTSFDVLADSPEQFQTCEAANCIVSVCESGTAQCKKKDCWDMEEFLRWVSAVR